MLKLLVALKVEGAGWGLVADVTVELLLLGRDLGNRNLLISRFRFSLYILL